ncbi:uncharacterized protein Bfra_009991ia [Botrytis fragariae]|uniref:Uncharacterized protein n=1 Tax=Botrytis fragariae TaxID=1964551 RepID=A0A8H6EFR3_9HELO|nr:uncharacterized protein Bfra_009991ia [Botrytis fragariae]KAF5870602.1 hypothetical protein Bfra_009991ia [Botrytis fragariae]
MTGPSRPSRPPVPLFSGPSRITQFSSSPSSASRSSLPPPPPINVPAPIICSRSSSVNSFPESPVRISGHGADISMPDANSPILSAVAMGKRPQIHDSDDEDMMDIGISDSDIPASFFDELGIESDIEDEIPELVTLSDARILSVDRLNDIAQESQIDPHPSVDDEPQGIEMEDIEDRPIPTLQAPEDLVLRHKMKKSMGGDEKEARPYIYIHCLVNFEGDSRTTDELKQIISSLQIYIRGYSEENDEQSQNFANEVDNAIESRGSMFRPGQRRYVEKESWKENILKWIKALGLRLEFEIIHSCGSKPLSRPLTEVGYAQSLDRLEQRRKHRSYDYIMDLVEAVCRVHFIQEYKNRQYIIFNLMEASDGMCDEILCTRFAQGYIVNDGGSSHCAAGISVHTKRRLGDEYWSKVRKEIFTGGGIGRRERKLIDLKENWD